MAFLSMSLSDLYEQHDQDHVCHGCGESLKDDESTTGMFLWVRGSERRPETVPVCRQCGTANALTAFARLHVQEEEG
jgi:ribosomal protein L37AE/L43A